MTEVVNRVVIVDDHPLLNAGLRSELERSGMEAIVAELGPASELIRWITNLAPQCVVVDLGLPLAGGGLSLVKPLSDAGCRVAVLTGESDVVLWAECSRAGAEVVLSKAEDLSDIVQVIVEVAAGHRVRPQQRVELSTAELRVRGEREERLGPFRALSPREEQVLAGLMEGHSVADLAARDFVSVQTVRTQVKSVLRKLGVRSQLEAVAKANLSNWKPKNGKTEKTTPG